jgi:flagellin
MTSQIRGLNQAVRNSNDAISMVQVAEGAMKEVTNMFQRMRELAVQAISDSNTAADRTALNNEYKQLSSEVQRIAENTQWNGTNILDGARTQTTFQIGANANQTIDVNFGDLANNSVSVTNNAVTSTADAAGKSIVTFAGTFAEGDVISYKIDDKNFGGVTLSSVDATALNAGTAATSATSSVLRIDQTSGATQVIGTSANQSSNAAVVVTVSAAKQITITGPTVAAGTSFNLTDIQVSRGTHAPVAGTDITSSTLATTALGVLDTAIGGINSTRAGLGASMSRLEYASDNLQNVSQNTSAARSRVLDADYAAETTELARTQIIQQASTAMLSQANQAQQSVLALLK